MDQNERDAGRGRLARQYAENEEAIAILLSRCNELGERLSRTGKDLLKNPERVLLAGTQDIQVDGESIGDLIDNLREAREKKVRLGHCLEGAGLAGLVRH